MPPNTPIFEIILAKIVILTDAILEIFVQAPSISNIADLTNCSSVGVARFTSNGLTDCGTALVGQLGGLINQTIGLLNGALAAFGVVNPVNP